MSREEQDLERMRIREEIRELSQEILMIDQRLMRMVDKIRHGLCDVGLELMQEPAARLKRWQESGIVEAGELVHRSREIQPLLAQKEQALKSYDDA
jgi:hypothetical protein